MPAPLPLLFAAGPEAGTLDLPDARLSYRPRFLDAAGSSALFRELYATPAWSDETLIIAGRSASAPRRVAWYGRTPLRDPPPERARAQELGRFADLVSFTTIDQKWPKMATLSTRSSYHA